jgi:hypothetical protein
VDAVLGDRLLHLSQALRVRDNHRGRLPLQHRQSLIRIDVELIDELRRLVPANQAGGVLAASWCRTAMEAAVAETNMIGAPTCAKAAKPPAASAGVAPRHLSGGSYHGSPLHPPL